MASNAPVSGPRAHPFAGMTRLSPQAWVRDSGSAAAVSSASATSPSPPPPRIVLFASWMGALDVHIAKYTARYEALYPAATILVVKFAPAQLWSAAAGRKAVQAAVTYLKSQVDAGVLSSSPSSLSSATSSQDRHPPQLLIHLFSNGGATTMQNIYSAWHASSSSSSSSSPSSTTPFPASVAIFDSAPGMPSLRRTYRAFAVSALPKPLVLRLVFTPLLVAVCLLGWLYVAVLMKRVLVPLGLAGEDMLSRNFHVLNDASSSSSSEDQKEKKEGGSYIGVVGRQTLRTYIYSKEDDMIDWQHVEQHAADAASGGVGLGGGKGRGSSSSRPRRAKIPCRL
ncbi:hypothetical protein Micbo1qcDRAFT_155086, partial [Microdochium bolleyi]